MRLNSGGTGTCFGAVSSGSRLNALALQWASVFLNLNVYSYMDKNSAHHHTCADACGDVE